MGLMRILDRLFGGMKLKVVVKEEESKRRGSPKKRVVSKRVVKETMRLSSMRRKRGHSRFSRRRGRKLSVVAEEVEK